MINHSSFSNMQSGITQKKSGPKWLGLLLGLVIVVGLAVTAFLATAPLIDSVNSLRSAVNDSPLIGNGVFMGISNYHVGTLMVTIIMWGIGLAVALGITFVMGGNADIDSDNPYGSRDIHKYEHPAIKRTR